MDTGIVAISQDELEKLKEDSLFLAALHRAGLQSWEWYDSVHALYCEDRQYRQEEGI